MSKKTNTKSGESIGFIGGYSSIDDKNFSEILLDETILWDDSEDWVEEWSPVLAPEEKISLGDTMEEYRKNITTSWLKNGEMREFYKKYDLTIDEINEYIGYFWGEKVFDYIVNELRCEYKKNENYKYISTRFLSFIKTKNIGIDDLLKIVIILKGRVIRFFLNQDTKMLNEIIDIFDKASTSILKNYNDIVIKLLDEYINAIDNSSIISKTDIYGNITSVNEEFCRLSWFTKDELIGKPHNIVRHPDMPKELFQNLWNTIQGKKIWKGIIKNKMKNGWSYWVNATIAPILDENNNIVEYISMRTDITELKEAHKNLEEYTEVLNDTNMVLKLDSFWKIISINDIFLKMSWYDRKELLGKIYITGIIWSKKFFPSFEKKQIPLIEKEETEEICKVLQWKQTWKWVIKNQSKVGNFFWTSANIVPITNLNNEIFEYIVIQNDVTDLEIAQQNLKISLNKQKELDVKKDEFLNIASHELRTPMTSIKGYLSMILDGDAGEINDEIRTYLTQVYKSSQRLLDLINDMLDISKIESGKQEFIMKSTDIASLVKETAMEVTGLFEKKQQNFIISIDFEKFEYTTDENKLKQVLLNLLWNANKFTPVGWVVTLDCKKNDRELTISIKDSGIGIEKSDFHKVFEKFWQVKNSLTRDINGTGLGLPIVKAIVEQMNGHMTMESEVWKGSMFSVHLPVNHI